jgi:hypothetical protein
METVVAGKWWLVLPTYLVGGLVLGLADPNLGRWIQQLGTRPGVATAVSVNVLLPLLAVALGVICPRLGTVWLGALVMAGAFAAGLAVRYLPAGPWDVAGFMSAIPPVLVMACVGYAILGTIAALVTRAVVRLHSVS